MNELIIVGAGGFGRELLQWIKDINLIRKKWIIKGFIDDNLQALSNYECDYSVIGKISEWVPSENEVYALAIADPKIKENIVSKLKIKKAKFTSVIHPTSQIGSFNIIGEGFVAYPGARITVNVKIGDFVTLLSSSVGHDAKIGDFSTISSFCGITRGVDIRKRVFLGCNVVIAPERKIGDDAYIGLGSIVINNVKPGTKVFGNPAKKNNFS